MPLLKLWNSLIGRTAAAKGPEATAVTTRPETPTRVLAAAPSAPVAVAKSVAADSSPSGTTSAPSAKKKSNKAAKGKSTAELRLAAFETPVVVAPVVVAPVVVPPTRQPKVVTRGEYAEICRLAIATGASSVLEIGVGHAGRAEAVMQSLQAVSGDKPLRYAAIDQFEMVGGPITLKDFHHRMRCIEVRPQVFPEPVIEGLSRFSRTVGFADLVIASTPDAQWNTSEVQSLIARITRSGSIVLHQSGGRWQQQALPHANPTSGKKAA